jgi:hypothetical protein
MQPKGFILLCQLLYIILSMPAAGVGGGGEGHWLKSMGKNRSIQIILKEKKAVRV